MFTRHPITFLFICTLIASGVGCNQDKVPVSGSISNQLLTGTATVESINPATRQIVLRRSDGAMLRFRVDKDVRNLEQVKAGDRVKVSYYESLAWEVKKAGQATPGAEVTASMDRAQPGAKPGGNVEQALKLTSTIAGIDKSAQTVTLRSAAGESTTFKVRDPKNLDRVAVGDLVEITYTEGVAVSVSAPE
jgi:Cu/Ag efflux protein CusF